MKISRERLKQIIKEELESLSNLEEDIGKLVKQADGTFKYVDAESGEERGEVEVGKKASDTSAAARSAASGRVKGSLDRASKAADKASDEQTAQQGFRMPQTTAVSSYDYTGPLSKLDRGKPIGIDSEGNVQYQNTARVAFADDDDAEKRRPPQLKKSTASKTRRVAKRSGGGGNLAAAKKEMRAARAAMKQELKDKGVSSVYDLDKTNEKRRRFARAYTALKRAKAGGGGSSRRMMAKSATPAAAEAPKTVAQARAQSPKSVAPLRPDEPKTSPGASMSDIYSQEAEKQRQTKEIEARRRAAARKKKRQDLLTSLSPGDLKRFYKARRERAVDLQFSGLSPEASKKIAAKQALDALERAGSGGFATALFDTPLYGGADAGGSGKKQPAGSERMVAKGKDSKPDNRSRLEKLEDRLAATTKELKTAKGPKISLLKQRQRLLKNQIRDEKRSRRDANRRYKRFTDSLKNKKGKKRTAGPELEE